MTTKVTITNDNQGAPYADWAVELVDPDGTTVIATLQPGESSQNIYLWHDGRELRIREKPKT
jgi:hypothetical protein